MGMGLDGVMLACIVDELKATLLGGRIRKIYQPEAGLLILHLWNLKTYRLLISVSQNSRIHLTESSPDNPERPPNFCMLLRKHLRNGILIGIEQPELERIVELHVRAGEGTRILSAELMGRNSNVILRTADGQILGAMRQGTGPPRSLIPGAPYQPPPSQGKRNPMTIDEAGFQQLLGGEEKVWRTLFARIQGIGPQLAKEIPLQADIPPSRSTDSLSDEEQAELWRAFAGLFDRIRRGAYQPTLYRDPDGAPIAVAPFELAGYRAENLEAAGRNGPSATLDEYHNRAGGRERFEALRHSLDRFVVRQVNKVERALERVEADRSQALEYERYREAGDLILTHLDRIEAGVREVEVEDLFAEAGGSRTISLDPRLSSKQNAQRYYRRYKKLKRGAVKLAKRQQELEAELTYLREVTHHLSQAEWVADLEEIADELREQGYREVEGAVGLRRRDRTQGIRSQPRRYSLDGYPVLVGRNGRQNDRLIREAARTDYWFHARGVPGAHVILKTNNQPERVPDTVLHKAAALAAYHSKARNATWAEVSYTQVKYLRKPKGAKPGAVILTRERTLTVAPEPVEESQLS
ncbi:MAG: NFACT family protein [Candidatus Bipolaricaulia bacterium]